MYVSWVLGDKLRIVMSSIMRWRRGEIGLVIGGLLSVGLHERAILADRTPPTDDPTPIGTANGPKGIYGRRSLSKPPKPTILDLSHRPHHRRLPRQRFSAMTGYGTGDTRVPTRITALPSIADVAVSAARSHRAFWRAARELPKDQGPPLPFRF